jgi:hypothetical protein
VWRKIQDGTLWLKEFKTTAGRQVDWIYKDEQPMVYSWVAGKLYSESIAGILYTFLFKKVPTFPKRKKNGEFSKSKQQNTTAELFVEALKQDARENSKGNEDEYNRLLNIYLAEYYDIINHFAEERRNHYLWRQEVQKTDLQLELNMDRIDMTSKDMLDPEVRLYNTPDMIKCARCAFKDPCRVREAGGDYEIYLQEDFRERRSWDAQAGTDRGTDKVVSGG